LKTEKKSYRYLTKAITCPDGSRKYIRAKTQKELDAKVRAALAELDRGININDNTTFGELAQMWLDLVKKPYLKPQSLQTLMSRINNHLMPSLGPMRVRDIKPTHVSHVMRDMAHLAHQSQNLIFSDLKAIFRFGIDNRIITTVPVPSSLKAGGRPASERSPLTPDESAALLEASKAGPEWLEGFVLLGLYTGLRASEICGLCWDCVDFERGLVLVRRQVCRGRGNGQITTLTTTLKTPESKRDIPVPPVLLDHLREKKRSASTITVLSTRNGKMVNSSMAGAVLHERAKAVRPDIHPHLLRHTYATRLVESGFDIKTVQYLLGHTTPHMTLKIYAHYDKRSRIEETANRVASVSFTGLPVAKVLQIANA
jgi:integrase